MSIGVVTATVECKAWGLPQATGTLSGPTLHSCVIQHKERRQQLCEGGGVALAKALILCPRCLTTRLQAVHHNHYILDAHRRKLCGHALGLLVFSA